MLQARYRDIVRKICRVCPIAVGNDSTYFLQFLSRRTRLTGRKKKAYRSGSDYLFENTCEYLRGLGGVLRGEVCVMYVMRILLKISPLSIGK